MSLDHRFAIGAGRERPSHEPKSLNCPNCGAGLTVPDEQAELLVCSSCQSHLDLSVGEAKALSKPLSDSDWGFQLAIGERWVDNDRPYEVVARMVYAEQEQYITRQYLLFSPRLGSFWASEYENAWTLSRPTRVLPQSDPFELNEGDRLKTGNGASWRKTGGGRMELKWVEGALPWKAEIGDKLVYAEFGGEGGAFYEAQRTQNELEYGMGQKLSAQEVLSAAGIVGSVDADKVHRRGCVDGCMVIFGFIVAACFALVLLFFLFFSFFDYFDAEDRDRAERRLSEYEAQMLEIDYALASVATIKESFPALLKVGEGPNVIDLSQSFVGKLNSLKLSFSKLPTVEYLKTFLATNEVGELYSKETIEDFHNGSYDLHRANNAIEEGLGALPDNSYIMTVVAATQDPEGFKISVRQQYETFLQTAGRWIGIAEKAALDWPDSSFENESRLRSTKALRASVEEEYLASLFKSQTKPDGAALRQVLAFSNTVRSADHELKDLDLKGYALRLYEAKEVVLVDMNVRPSGDKLVFRQKLATFTMRQPAWTWRATVSNAGDVRLIRSAGEQVTQPEVSERWLTVTRATFMREQPYLGMSLAHKTFGSTDVEVRRQVTIPGFAHICSPEQCTRNGIGEWAGERPQRYWRFAAAYAWIGLKYWPRDFVMTEEQYTAHRLAIRQNRTHFGALASRTSAFFGASASSMLVLYATGRYASNGGFDVDQMERRLQREIYVRQQSYRDSYSSGSRSSWGK